MDLDIRNDKTAVWTFPIRPTAGTIEEFRSEFPDMLERVFAALEPVYVPQHASWAGSLYESDVALAEAVGIGATSVGRIRDALDRPAGFTPADIADAFEAVLSRPAEYPVIDVVDWKNGIVTLSQDGERAISSEKAAEFVRDDVVVDPDASTHHVLSVWMDLRATAETDHEPELTTKIRTSSGLWFQDTQDSRRNRDRLREALRSIAAEFEVEYVHTTTALYKLEECNLTEDDILR